MQMYATIDKGEPSWQAMLCIWLFVVKCYLLVYLGPRALLVCIGLISVVARTVLKQSGLVDASTRYLRSCYKIKIVILYTTWY